MIESKWIFDQISEALEARFDALRATVRFGDVAWIREEVRSGRIPYFGPGSCYGESLPADYFGLLVCEPESGIAVLEMHWQSETPDTYGPTAGMYPACVSPIWNLPRGTRCERQRS